MKKFQFNAERILRYRRHLERVAQLKVGQTQAEIQRSRQQIAAYKNNYKNSSRALGDHAGQGLSAYTYQMHTAYLQAINTDLAKESNHQADLLQTLNQRRQVLAQKAVEKKVLEKLKEKKQLEYYEHLKKLEQKQIDDLNAIRKGLSAFS